MALAYPAGAVLVVGGVPGAGKSELVRRLVAPPVRALDSAAVRDRYRRRLGGRLPYRWYRPAVHAEHYLRLAWALRRPGTLVVHDTATRSWVRRWIAALARRHHGSAHLLFLDVPAEDALAGQRARGRVVRSGAMRRHERRWRRLRAALARRPDALAAEGYASTVVLDRRGADAIRAIRFVGPRPGPPGAATPPTPAVA